MPATNNEVSISNALDYPSLVPSYSHISIVPISATKRLVSFAGQTGTSTTSMPLAEQVRAALANVDKCMASAGVTKEDIVSNRQSVAKLTSLSAADFKAREVGFLEWWWKTEGDRLPPPDTLIGVDSLASNEILYGIEITCVADR